MEPIVQLGQKARRHPRLALAALAALLAVPRFALGDAGDAAPTTAPVTVPAAVDPSVVNQLIKRLDEQEAELKELRAKVSSQTAPTTAPATEPVDAEVRARLDAQQKDMDDLKQKVTETTNQVAAAAASASETTYPSLQFHGFGDIDYHVGSSKQDKSAFTLGEFDVFVTSQLSPDLSVLNETVLSADSTNTYGIEIERLLLQYHPSEWFNVDVGRYHTDIGYYSTTYHHGTWLQTATNRPFFLQFEDSGGIFAVHNVGISVYGAIPSGSLGLNYHVEIGNGRQYQAPTSSENQVGNIFDDNNYKAFNIALAAKPEWAPGLQFGGGLYFDQLTPPGIARTDEYIIHSHLIYKNADWEFLSEAYAMNHQTKGGGNEWSDAFYVQLARKFGAFTPYVRFTYLNASVSDPVYQLIQDVGRHYGPSVGVRYDVSTFVALKLQYDFMNNSNEGYDLGPTFNPIHRGAYSQVTGQLSFTF
jgi:hypothetical protein